MQEKLTEGIIEYSKNDPNINNPVFPIAFAFFLSVILVFAFGIWAFIKTRKPSEEEAKNLKEDRDFWKERFSNQQVYLEKSCDMIKETNSQLTEVRQEQEKRRLPFTVSYSRENRHNERTDCYR